MTALLQRTSEYTRQAVVPAIRVALERLHPDTARIAAYHLGWADPVGNPVAGNDGGKMIRSTLALLSSSAGGSDPADGVPCAVALELVHNFSLLHDDIMDSDRIRRGRPAAWTIYGVGPAILTGDALLALAVSTLAERPGASAEAINQLTTAITRLAMGQAADLAFESRPWGGAHAVTEREYLAMSGDKTGALFAAAACIAAAMVGAPADVTEALHTAGYHLGLAFQAIDDLLGIWGDPTSTGKPIYSDLRRGKKTLPVITALASGSAEARRLAALLETRPDSRQGLELAARLIEIAGGRSHTRDRVRSYLCHAVNALDNANIPDETATAFAALAHSLVDIHGTGGCQ